MERDREEGRGDGVVRKRKNLMEGGRDNGVEKTRRGKRGEKSRQRREGFEDEGC